MHKGTTEDELAIELAELRNIKIDDALTLLRSGKASVSEDGRSIWVHTGGVFSSYSRRRK